MKQRKGMKANKFHNYYKKYLHKPTHQYNRQKYISGLKHKSRQQGYLIKVRNRVQKQKPMGIKRLSVSQKLKSRQGKLNMGHLRTPNRVNYRRQVN